MEQFTLKEEYEYGEKRNSYNNNFLLFLVKDKKTLLADHCVQAFLWPVKVSQTCLLFVSLGVSLDGQRTDLPPTKFTGAFVPPTPSLQPSSCPIHASPVDPHIIHSSPSLQCLALHRFTQQLKSLLIFLTPSAQKLLHLVRALLQSLYHCRCSAIILSLLSAP